ncbi:HB2C protein, partial [Malurus elegans]|nr:HB2C protein [Malurus elegans]
GAYGAAGAVLVALMVLGASLAVGTELSGVLLFRIKHECHFINNTDWQLGPYWLIHNREQLLHFNSDVGHFVGNTCSGEIQGRHLNSKREWLEYQQ